MGICRILWFLLVVFVFHGITSFNIDIRTNTLYQNPTGNSASYFGFSVAIHSNQNKKWLVAGAPLSDVTSSGGTPLPGYGAAFKCSTAGSKNCSFISIDNSPEREGKFPYNGSFPYFTMEMKSGQWLGGTVLSTGHNGKLLVCAPRYIHKQDARNEKTSPFHGPMLKRFPSGKCFLVRSDLSGVDSKDILQPCKRRSNNPYNGYCQLGFSADSLGEQSSVVMGTVGWGDYRTMKVYAGGIEKYSPASNFIMSPTQQLSTDDYMGYSVAVGHFTLPNKTEVAGGAPRGDNVKGKVLIYEDITDSIVYRSRLQRPRNLQAGSYFGSTICAVDLNNDGYTDLLVGAPLFTETKDEGRVFVYINSKNGVLSWRESMTLVGDSLPGARFGSAIASAGDLNRDGYQDVVIGAPYEGPNGEGAVYVYYGTKRGIEARYRQKIPASSVSGGLRGFGCSVSGAVDADDNGYPDIAVGSYTSGHAVLLKTRRIIELGAAILLSRKEIVLEHNDFMCKEWDGTSHKCLNATFCFQYADREPSNTQDLRISYTIELEKDKASIDLRRMYFYQNAAPVLTVRGETAIGGQRQLHCLPAYPVHIREKHELLDLLNPLTFDVTFSLADKSCELDKDVPCPVLDDYRPKALRNKELSFQKQCRGEVCKPDMGLRGHLLFPNGDKVVHIGSTSVLGVALEIGNDADDASYQTKVILDFPPDLSYIGPRLSAENIQCISSYVNGTAKGECDVGNPFKGKFKKNLVIDFETSKIINDFSINVKVTSANKDVNPKNDKITLPVAAHYLADIAITGVSQPSEVIYHGDVTKKKEVEFQRDIGPEIVQTFVITNYGPSTVDQVEVSVNVPQLYRQKDSYLLYLLKVELTAGAGRCNAVANPLGIPAENLTADSNQPPRNIETRTAARTMRMNCKSSICYTFRCQFGLLERGDFAEITTTSRLWQSTLVKAKAGVAEIETTARLTLPRKVMQTNTLNDRVSVVLKAIPSRAGSTKEDTAWWIILLAVLGGLILLAIVIALMYKFGFFKRHRHEDASSDPEESKPMNA